MCILNIATSEHEQHVRILDMFTIPLVHCRQRGCLALALSLYFLLLIPRESVAAESDEFCIYITSSGQIQQVASLADVPARYKE